VGTEGKTAGQRVTRNSKPTSFKVFIASSTTLSSHQLSISQKQKIPRKASHYAIKLKSENFGSLYESLHPELR
jgi:hypothetical protein